MEQLNNINSRALRRIAQIFLYVALFAAFCQGAYVGWPTALRYALWAGGAVLLITLIGKLLFKTPKQESGKSGLSALDIAIICVLCALAMFSLCSIAIGIYSTYELAISPDLSRTTSIVFVGLLTFIVGVALFTIRLRWRCLYGISEALVGIIVASQRYYTEAVLTSTPTPSLALAILTAGVYLVVRGADNIHQGLTKSPFDPMGQRFLKWANTLGREQEEGTKASIPTSGTLEEKPSSTLSPH